MGRALLYEIYRGFDSITTRGDLRWRDDRSGSERDELQISIATYLTYYVTSL